jgi:hypothetical protein
VPRHPEAILSGRVDAIDLPGNYLGDQIPLLVGIQHGQEIRQITPLASADTASFDFEFALAGEGDSVDVRGPFVHGRKGDRFVYLVWGHPTQDDPFVRYARTKLMFNDIPMDLMLTVADGSAGGVLVCTLQATSDKGTESSGTVRPPRVSWAIEAS